MENSLVIFILVLLVHLIKIKVFTSHTNKCVRQKTKQISFRVWVRAPTSVSRVNFQKDIPIHCLLLLLDLQIIEDVSAFIQGLNKNLDNFQTQVKVHFTGLPMLPLPNCARRHTIFTFGKKRSIYTILFCVKAEYNKRYFVKQKQIRFQFLII